jgi:hypothetical protein
MMRTVYQFHCTLHDEDLRGTPRLILDQENGSWHISLHTMTCREGEQTCSARWSMRTCDHLHKVYETGRYPRCNSMTCWNYRGRHFYDGDIPEQARKTT